ncbi:MAG: hypothetical protein QG553_599 [Patescibacteria group bacterium]|nr:hypothetical protein [Patescibacteria group bacterium]
MSDNKTQPTKQSVAQFIDAVEDPQKRADSHQLIKMMTDITGEKPVMWGPTMIGFGSYHYKYESGREGDFMVVGFSPRKAALVLYGLIYYDKGQELLKELGPHKAGKGCLYIKRLADIDQGVLGEMIRLSFNAPK